MNDMQIDPPQWRDTDGVRLLRRARSTDEIVAVLRETARPTIGCDGFCFILRDGALCHYAAEDAMAPLWEGRRFPLDACVSGWAMRMGRTAVIPDIFEYDRVPHALYSQTFVRSMAMAPAADPAQAALGAYWSQRGRPSSRSVRLLEDLAAAVGEALAWLEPVRA